MFRHMDREDVLTHGSMKTLEASSVRIPTCLNALLAISLAECHWVVTRRRSQEIKHIFSDDYPKFLVSLSIVRMTMLE
jgi:hypothetical protein